MSWEYFLVPLPRGSRFPPVLVAQMEEYWASNEASFRRSDGAHVVMGSEADRDEVVKSGLVDAPRHDAQFVLVRPEEVTFAVVGLLSQSREFVRFMRWVAERAPCELLDESMKPLSFERFLEIQVEANLR